MNRLVAVLMVVLVLLVSILGAGVYYAWNSPSPTPTPFPPPTLIPSVTPMPTPRFDVDASWITEVLRLLEDAKPYQHEFNSLIETLMLVSQRTTDLSENHKKSISELQKDVKILSINVDKSIFSLLENGCGKISATRSDSRSYQEI